MESLSDWALSNFPRTIQLLRDLGPVCAALIAAIIASLIQWRQWRTADRQREIAADRFRLDIFDRRYEVFQAIHCAILNTLHGTIYDKEQAMKIQAKRVEAWFLFGGSVHKFMEETDRAMFIYSRFRNENNLSVEHATAFSEASDKLVEAVTKAEAVFRPYLSFERIRAHAPPLPR